ncbi:hypothetical protein SEA_BRUTONGASTER_157 [Gordonia phage BrutonGaster]|uniref:Uncharacterized protein n=1 Tax=Gordonia phage BrutonGaster TaxID=2530116 RepID=A0A482JHW7_9CAUD|nr:hypothetical protein HOV26_gp025 [Gordonia phage BrutonGaster]QBP33371.1 hypothetical protein SEA_BRUTONGASTER_157 [Gordonia phage BrutonGaster]
MAPRSTKPLYKQTNGIGGRAMVSNILSVFDQATDADIIAGQLWYKEAFDVAQQCALLSNRQVEACAVAIAHLSPQVKWEDNVAFALALATPGAPSYQAPRVPGTAGLTHQNWRKAYQALYLSDDPLGEMTPGIKTHAFAHNILGHTEYVTVDSWAMRIAGVDYRYINRVGVYAGVSNAYTKAAQAVGVEPSEMQAITWVAAHNPKDKS